MLKAVSPFQAPEIEHVTPEELAEAMEAWSQGIDTVPKPVKREHPM